MTLRNLYLASHCDLLTLNCITLAPALYPIQLLRYAHYYPYWGTVFSLSATMMDFLYSTCSRKNGPTMGSKQGGQEKPMHTPSGQEKGQSS